MHESFLRALALHRPALRARWMILLRAAPVSGPLANPDSLVFLMDWTINRLIAKCHSARRRRCQGRDPLPAPCPCGHNPLHHYYATAERALVESRFVESRELAALAPGVRDAGLTEVQQLLGAIGRREIESFCAVCQFRPEQPASACRHSAMEAVAVNGR